MMPNNASLHEQTAKDIKDSMQNTTWQRANEPHTYPIYTFSINAVAYAAMPSCRPTKPIRSEVVALIDTASGSTPINWAIHCCMAGMWGLILGCSAHTVASTLPTR